jgi:hypothetical protein
MMKITFEINGRSFVCDAYDSIYECGSGINLHFGKLNGRSLRDAVLAIIAKGSK